MNNSVKQGIAVVVLIAALTGIAIAANKYGKITANTDPQKTAGIKTIKTITYKGQDGKTVLYLLKQNHQVEAKDSEYGTVVNGIDGTKQTDNAIWLYYIDGTPAAESADKAMTKNGQTIEWKYENF